MDLNRWTQVGFAGRWVPRRAINLTYTLESSIDDRGVVRYRAKNISNDAIVPLSGNKGESIVNFVSFDENPERDISSSWYPMLGYPYVLSTELPGWFYVVLDKQ